MGSCRVLVEVDKQLVHALRYGWEVDLSVSGEPHFLSFSMWADGEWEKVAVVYVDGAGFDGKIAIVVGRIRRLPREAIDYIFSKEGLEELRERLMMTAYDPEKPKFNFDVIKEFFNFIEDVRKQYEEKKLGRKLEEFNGEE